MNESDPRSDVHYLGSSENKFNQRNCLKKVSLCTVKVGGCILKRNVVH